MAAIKPHDGVVRAVQVSPPMVGPADRSGAAADIDGPPRRSVESFGDALAVERLTWSRHARERLATRRMALSSADLARIAEGVDRAAAKGARDSLVLLNELALIVNVPNRTVLTALDSRRLQEGVVTNIDSTVFV